MKQEIEWHYLPELPDSDKLVITSITSCWGNEASYYLYTSGGFFPKCVYAWAYLPTPPPHKEAE